MQQVLSKFSVAQLPVRRLSLSAFMGVALTACTPWPYAAEAKTKVSVVRTLTTLAYHVNIALQVAQPSWACVLMALSTGLKLSAGAQQAGLSCKHYECTIATGTCGLRSINVLGCHTPLLCTVLHLPCSAVSSNAWLQIETSLGLTNQVRLLRHLALRFGEEDDFVEAHFGATLADDHRTHIVVADASTTCVLSYCLLLAGNATHRNVCLTRPAANCNGEPR